MSQFNQYPITNQRNEAATGHPTRLSEPTRKRTIVMKTVIKFNSVKILGLGALVSLSSLAQAQSNDSLQARLDELDQKVRVIERLNEIAQEDAKAAAAKAPKVLAGEGGFGVASGDGAYSLRLRGFVQPQAVYILSDVGAAPTPGINNFSIKRLHTDIVGSLGKQLEYRSHINFASGSAELQDAYLDWKILPEFSIRAGKFKPPTGLERLLSYSRAPFVEASFVPALQPNRDIGIQVFGDIEKGLVEYQFAYLAGARDGLNNTGDNNEEKDLYGRVFSHPFVKSGSEALKGFGLGISGSYGQQAQYSGALPSYSTGRQGFFSYNAADTSVGKVIRYSPQAYYYFGPLGVIAEYTATTQTVRRAAFEEELTNSAWAVTTSYFLTGDKNSYKGIKIKKANTFPSFESLGAIEVLSRVTGIQVDDKAFEPLSTNQSLTFANEATQASAALGYGFAIKWYLNNSVNIFTGWETTHFTGGAGTAATATVAAAPVDRQVESVLTTAFNVTF